MYGWVRGTGNHYCSSRGVPVPPPKFIILIYQELAHFSSLLSWFLSFQNQSNPTPSVRAILSCFVPLASFSKPHVSLKARLVFPIDAKKKITKLKKEKKNQLSPSWLISPLSGSGLVLCRPCGLVVQLIYACHICGYCSSLRVRLQMKFLNWDCVSEVFLRLCTMNML